MYGFKNTTKTQYSRGGYAKGGVKGAAKVGKVMGEFKAGTLHSGSKKGPEVTNPKQAIAIGLSQARKAVVKKAGGGAMTDAEKRMVAIEKNERTQAPKPATSKPATTSGNKPMSDAEKRMMNIEKNETGEYKKGGMAKPSRADALRAQKYKAAMASRPNRQPVVGDGQRAAAALAPIIRRAMAAKAAQAAAAQAASQAPPADGSPMGAPDADSPAMGPSAGPPMGAPVMKKGGKVMKKADGGMATSIRPTKDYNQADTDFVAARASQLNNLVGKPMKKGGLDSDTKQDKAMVKAAIHKHERHDHPGKPLTKLRKGGMPC